MSAEAWIFLGGIVTAVSGLVIAYWQFVLPARKKRDEKPTAPTAGERALDEIFDQLDEVRAELKAERKTHDVTRSKYGDVRRRLAKVEAEAEALRSTLAERDQSIEWLKASIERLRQEVTDMRKQQHGS